MRNLYSFFIALAVFAFLGILASHPPGNVRTKNLPVEADKAAVQSSKLLTPPVLRPEQAAAASDPISAIVQPHAASPTAQPIQQLADTQPSGTNNSPARGTENLSAGDTAAGRQAFADADISRDPKDLPPPLPKRAAQSIRIDLVTEEIEGRLAEGTNFGYWTFNGKVPGPFLRVRVGDTLDVHVKNPAENSMIHSVDFHAATGPGGGAAALQVEPGAEKSVRVKMLVPGLYLYHCATPMVAMHIANGMYGMILVEPEAGLPKVDREFYVMQGEIYTNAPFGQHGSQEFSVEKLLAEHPEYFVFNGSVGALTTLHPMHAAVGETVRVFFGVGGPNFTSSFHVIGTTFDKVYDRGGTLSEPLRGIQTTTVAPGGATIAEFTLKVPGRYAFVDHAMARMERGLVGILVADGPQQPKIFDGQASSEGGGY